jgi:hypothetical protein
MHCRGTEWRSERHLIDPHSRGDSRLDMTSKTNSCSQRMRKWLHSYESETRRTCKRPSDQSSWSIGRGIGDFLNSNRRKLIAPDRNLVASNRRFQDSREAFQFNIQYITVIWTSRVRNCKLSRIRVAYVCQLTRGRCKISDLGDKISRRYLRQTVHFQTACFPPLPGRWRTTSLKATWDRAQLVKFTSLAVAARTVRLRSR